MKKLITAAAVSLAAVLGSSAPASAFFGCLGCCKKDCTYTISVRPYNAFSPVCYGKVCCDGCGPTPGCYPGAAFPAQHGPYGGHAPHGYQPAYSHGDPHAAGLPQGAVAPQGGEIPHGAALPSGPAQAPAEQIQAPQSGVRPLPVGQVPYQRPYGQMPYGYGAAPANPYQPGYAPAYPASHPQAPGAMVPYGRGY